MTTYLTRRMWTDVPAPRGLTPLDPPDVRGVAVHWPGSKASMAGLDMAGVARRLESYRRLHVSPPRGWTDIAYQWAVDDGGRCWELRGFAARSAANGDTGPNAAWGAVLLLLGAGDPVTDAMREAVYDLRAAKWLPRYPDATRVVTHDDVRPGPTDCPGPAATAAVRAGLFTTRPKPAAPPTEEDDDMAWDDPIALGENTRRQIRELTGRDEASLPAAVILQRLYGNVLAIGRQVGAPVVAAALREALAEAPDVSLTDAQVEALAVAVAAKVERVSVTVEGGTEGTG